MRRKITKTAVDNLSPGPRNAFLWDTEIAGFGCKITPAGPKVYILRYRTEDQDSRKAPKRIALGKHGAYLHPTGRPTVNQSAYGQPTVSMASEPWNASPAKVSAVSTTSVSPH